jgi:hypothetical protein
VEPKVPMPSSTSSSLSILVVMSIKNGYKSTITKKKKRFPRDEAKDKLVKGLDCKGGKFVETTYHIIIIKLDNSKEQMSS